MISIIMLGLDIGESRFKHATCRKMTCLGFPRTARHFQKLSTQACSPPRRELACQVSWACGAWKGHGTRDKFPEKSAQAIGDEGLKPGRVFHSLLDKCHTSVCRHRAKFSKPDQLGIFPTSERTNLPRVPILRNVQASEEICQSSRSWETCRHLKKILSPQACETCRHRKKIF